MAIRCILSFLVGALTVACASCSKSGGESQPNPQPGQQPTNAYKVSVYAGKIGSPGYADGPALSAQFRIMDGLTVDAQGIIYAVDPDNNRIRRIALDSSVSTLSGTGEMAFADGPIATAKFFKPADIAVDGQGNLIIADVGNHRIRKITPAGMVSTVAGDGTHGYVDGNAANARFDQPRGVCVDTQGNIYVVDLGNRRIRKISSSGVVSTVAGNGNDGFVNGNAANAEFSVPWDIEVDSQGNLFVSDRRNNVIRKISGGMVTTFAGASEGGYADGPAGSAKFLFPGGLVFDANGNLYVADSENHRIRKITPGGVVSTIAGKGTAGYTNGNADAAEFAEPRGITLDKKGNFYVGDALGYCIRKISM